MSVHETELKRLIADLPDRERRARTRYWIYAIIMLLAGVLWIVYSFYQVGRLNAESQSLKLQISNQQETLEATKQEIQNKNDQLTKVSVAFQIPAEDLQNLQNYGFLANDQNAYNVQAYIEESKKATGELQNIKSIPAEKARRANVAIRYYVRQNDNGRVASALDRLKADYGFAVTPNQGQKEPNTYTNAIWLNRFDMKDEDVKLVAYYLILRGIQIKYIGPPTSKAETVRRLVPESIVVVAEPKARDEPSLTVDRIKGLSMESLRRGTKTLNW